MGKERKKPSGLEAKAKVPVGTHVIWDDDGTECKGTIKKTFYDDRAFKRWFYVVEFKNETGKAKYTRKFDDQSFNDNLSIDTNYVDNRLRSAS
jgi:hypothetical protein